MPVVVLTGFLGAGKTTLLNGLLRQPAMADTAVIINEFGEIGIDHLLVDRIESDLLMLTTGCLCCAARGDLLTALADLLARRAGGTVRFERIMIETTGLADPGPVVNALLPSAVFGEAFRFERLVTVVDAAAGADRLQDVDEALRQVALADLLVLSKTDLLGGDDGSRLAKLEGLLRSLNPMAPILPSADPAQVLAALRVPPSSMRKSAGDHHHHHHHLAGIEALNLRAGTIDPRQFERFLTRLLAVHGAGLLRLKGLVATAADPGRPVLVNVVQDRIHPATILEGWPDPDHDTRLVVIAQNGQGNDIAGLWDAFFGPPRIDQPDAAALSSGLDERPGLF